MPFGKFSIELMQWFIEHSICALCFCILCVEFKNYGGSWQSIQDILYALCGGPCGGSSTPASGTLCGMKDTVRAELTTCMGYNPASSCPSGYTKKVMFAFQDNDVAYTHIIYSCVAN